MSSKIYDLICRRLLMAWHDDHIWAVTTLITAIHTAPAGKGKAANDAPIIDRYHSSGTAVEQVGWKILEIGAEAGERRKPPASAKPKTAAAENPPKMTLNKACRRD